MKIENLSLAEIVTFKPEAAAIFENYNLDFCCRGKQKLSEALSNDTSKLEEVTTRLKSIFEGKPSSETDFTKFSLTQLVDYILEKHHRYVKENLPVIQQHLEKVASKHGATHPEMLRIKVLFHEIARDFNQHIMKEEVTLFPRIKALETIFNEGKTPTENISIQSPVQVMEAEHEAAGKMMEEIKMLSNNFTPPENVCTTFGVVIRELKIFETDLHHHVHLENNILFPKALELQNNLNQTSCSCSL